MRDQGRTMTSRDLSLTVIRVLAVLHGLPALAAVLYGVYAAGYDVLDGDTGDWDGFGVAVGGILVVVGLVPLLLALAAASSSRPAVVRVCGGLLGAVGLGYGLFLEYMELVWFVPSLLLLAVAVGSALSTPVETVDSSA